MGNVHRQKLVLLPGRSGTTAGSRIPEDAWARFRRPLPIRRGDVLCRDSVFVMSFGAIDVFAASRGFTRHIREAAMKFGLPEKLYNLRVSAGPTFGRAPLGRTDNLRTPANFGPHFLWADLRYKFVGSSPSHASECMRRTGPLRCGPRRATHLRTGTYTPSISPARFSVGTFFFAIQKALRLKMHTLLGTSTD